jgi:Tfp pilus assembly protein PilO
MNAWKIHAIGGGVMLVLTAAAWFPLIEPVLAARNNYDVQIVQLQQERDRRADAEAKEKSKLAQIAALRAMTAASPLMLKTPQDVNTRLQAVADLAQKTGFQVDNIEAGRSEAFERYGAQQVRLSGRCRYAQLTKFFEALHKTMPDMSVSSADLTGRYSDHSSIPSVSTKLRWHTTAVPALASQ